MNEWTRAGSNSNSSRDCGEAKAMRLNCDFVPMTSDGSSTLPTAESLRRGEETNAGE